MVDKIKDKGDYYQIPKNVFTQDYTELYQQKIILKGIINKLQERLRAYERKDMAQQPNDIEEYSNGWRIAKCPVCNNVVTHNMQYCDKCGQHLLWDTYHAKWNGEK